jgi:hypothetical protein
VEADDDGLYVVKFRGAAQGQRTLVAEIVAGEIGRALGLLVPELVLVEMDEAIGRSEPDYEIRELLRRSAGLNLALDFLPGAIDYAPSLPPPPAEVAAKVVWLDAYTSNVDRTVKNPNLLVWHRQLWLIDHGAALYFHHGGEPFAERVREAAPRTAEHPLRALVTREALVKADAAAREVLSVARIRDIVRLVPEEWLYEPARDGAADEEGGEGDGDETVDGGGSEGHDVARAASAAREEYVSYLIARRDSSAAFMEAMGLP